MRLQQYFRWCCYFHQQRFKLRKKTAWRKLATIKFALTHFEIITLREMYDQVEIDAWLNGFINLSFKE